MRKKYFKIILSVWAAAAAALPSLASAATDALNKLDKVGSTKGPYQAVSDEFGVSRIVDAGVQAVLALIGVIFLVLMIYAGYNWMIARGEEEKVEKAKDTITRAIIGLIIVVGAYAIWGFVFNYLF